MINIKLFGATYDLCQKNAVNLFFPPYITFSEMLKAIYFKFDRDNRDLHLFYSCQNVNDKIKEIFNNRKEVSIEISLHGGVLGGILNKYGKLIYLHFPGYTINIGILNSNKKLIKDIECQEEKKVKKIYIEGKELNIGEEKSLLSLGIKEDCNKCIAEFDK